MAGPELQLHDCIHEDDFEQHKEDVKKIRNELKKGNSLFEFIKEEITILKDAVGAKNEENGKRDEQLKEIRQKTDEINNVKNKNETLYDKVDNVEKDLLVVKTVLKIDEKKETDKQKLKHIIIGGFLGAAFSFIFIIALEILRIYTSFL